ncbi:GNAT family N-acetyltransferase [Pullulanibacillus camelliae]
MTFTVLHTDRGQTLSFQKVVMARDLDRIYKWMNAGHVIPYWGLNMPYDAFKQHLQKALQDHHQTLYLGYVDDEPISYWEVYWAKDDIIGNYYAYGEADQGLHLLIGETRYLGKGYALPLLAAMVRYCFLNEETERVVAEPDMRNKKMIHIFTKCGFESVKPVSLPDKTGLLMICERERFERMWQDGLPVL